MKFRVLQTMEGQVVDLDGMRHFLWGWRVVECISVTFAPHPESWGIVEASADRSPLPHVIGTPRLWDAEIARNIAQAYHP